MLKQKDWKGVVLRDALAETLKAARVPMREGQPVFALDGYVEAHIEQGPRLENERKTIGVVTAIQGSWRYIVEIDGEEAHAGTTPRARTPSPPPHASPRRCTRRQPTRTIRCVSRSAGSRWRRARPTPCRARRASPSTCAIRR